MKKYHINKKGQATLCNADYNCPLKDENGEKQPHFATLQEAQDHYTKTLQAQQSLLPKTLRKPSNSNSKLKQQILNDIDTKNIPPEKAIEIGSAVMQGFKERLSFNVDEINSEDITSEQWSEITAVMLKNIDSISATGDEIKNDMLGNKNIQKILIQETKILPNSIKEKLQNYPIACETMRKNNANGWGGSYKHGLLKPAPSREKLPESHKELPEGVFYSKNIDAYTATSTDENYSASALRSNGDGTANVFHVSNNEYMKPMKNKYYSYKSKKDQSIVLATPYDDQPITLEGVTIYEQIGKVRDNSGVTISGWDNPSSPSRINMSTRAIYVHEYTHFVEDHVEGFQYSNTVQMFDRVKNSGVEALNDEGNMSPFPSDYMGEENGGEFLTRATESLFVPENSVKFYGKDRHPNADQILSWTAGMWTIAAIKSETITSS